MPMPCEEEKRKILVVKKEITSFGYIRMGYLVGKW
jgi:hypothetical protein